MRRAASAPIARMIDPKQKRKENLSLESRWLHCLIKIGVLLRAGHQFKIANLPVITGV
jgi:hypothetical protein